VPPPLATLEDWVPTPPRRPIGTLAGKARDN
jgi:hypothetical protein